jgi:adenosylcobinamide-phosphate guanylyltransferase
MLALIMAGGRGTRLLMGEKPLVTICGRPMLSYVIDAFAEAGHEGVVVTSRHTPYTINWCRAQGVTYYTALGEGYVEDIAESACELEETGAFFTSVSDIPCITPNIITDIETSYRASGKSACSTWIPRDLCSADDSRARYGEEVNGTPAYPAGINILTGRSIREPQEEIRLLIREPYLAFNINTREELKRVRRLLCDDHASRDPLPR